MTNEKAAQTVKGLERPFFRLHISIFAPLVFLAAGACTSQPQVRVVAQTPSEKVINQIWEATHTHELFESLPLKMPIQEMIEDRFRGTSPEYRAKIQDLLEKNLEPSRLQRMLKSQLLTRFNADKAEKVLKFYQTPFGQFYGAAGHHFDPESPEFQEFVQQEPNPDEKRLEQLARLLTAAGSAKFASITLVTPIETVFFELEHQKQLAGQRPHHEPASELRKSMNSVVKAMHKAMLLTASFVYRDLNDQQILELIEFESSSSAKWYNTMLLQSYEKTIQVAMRRFTRQLLQFIQDEPPPAYPPLDSGSHLRGG